MATSSAYVEQSFDNEQRNSILEKLFDKLANNTRTAIDKKIITLHAAFRERQAQSFRHLILAVCHTYINNGSILKGNRHTRLDIAEKILTHMDSYSGDDLAGQEVFEIILFIDEIAEIYINLDKNNDDHNAFISIPFRDNTSAIDKISYESILFSYIREAIKLAMGNIFNNIPNILENVPPLSNTQINIFIGLLSLRNMYIGTDHQKKCFSLIYKLANDYPLDNLNQNLIGLAYKNATAPLRLASDAPLLKSIDTIWEFILLQSIISGLQPFSQLNVKRLIINVIDVFRDVNAPQSPTIFDRLALKQYQSLCSALFDTLDRDPSHTGTLLLPELLSKEPFWRALLNAGASLLASSDNPDLKSGDFITQLVYHRKDKAAEWLAHKPRVNIVWSLILNESCFHLWMPSLLRLPHIMQTGASCSTDTSTRTACQPITAILTTRGQQRFFGELAATLDRPVSEQIILHLKTTSFVDLFDHEMILAIGALLQTVHKLGITLHIASPSAHAFISRWTIALVQQGRFNELSHLVQQQVITWDNALSRTPGDARPQLITALLYRITPDGVVSPQHVFNQLTKLLWSDEAYAAYQICLIPQSITSTAVWLTRRPVDMPKHFDAIMKIHQFYDKRTKAVFYSWWHRHENNVDALSRIDGRDLALLIACSVISSTNKRPLSWASYFWTHIIDRIGIIYTSMLLLRINNPDNLRLTLTQTYMYKNTSMRMIDIFHDAMKAPCTMVDSFHRDPFGKVVETEFQVTHYVRRLFNFNSKDFTPQQKIEIFSLFLIEEPDEIFVDLLSSCILELVNILRLAELGCKNHADSAKNISLIEDTWRWLLSHIKFEIWLRAIDEYENNNGSYIFNLIQQGCYVSFCRVLEVFCLHSPASLYNATHMLILSMEPNIDARFFNFILPFITLDLLEKKDGVKYKEKIESPFVFAIKLGERGLSFLKLMFEHYRLLKNDSDLTIKPSVDIVRAFLHSGHRQQNLFYEAIVYENIAVALWLLDLAASILDEVLAMDINKALAQRSPAACLKMLAIDIWLLQRGYTSFLSVPATTESESLATNPWGTKKLQETIMLYIQGGVSSLATQETALGLSLLQQMAKIKTSPDLIMSMAIQYQLALNNSEPAISPLAFFAFDTALAHELELRKQPLDQWLYWLEPKTELRLYVMQRLAAEGADPSSALRQTMLLFLAQPTGVSQHGLKILRKILTETDALNLTKTEDTIAASSSSTAMTASSSSMPTPAILRWETRFLQLVNDARRQELQSALNAPGTISPVAAAINSLPSTSSPSPSTTTCTATLYPSSSSTSDSHASGQNTIQQLKGQHHDQTRLNQ